MWNSQNKQRSLREQPSGEVEQPVQPQAPAVGDLNNLRNEIWCILGIYLSSGSPKSVPRPFYDFAWGELGGDSADAERLEQLNQKMEDLFKNAADLPGKLKDLLLNDVPTIPGPSDPSSKGLLRNEFTDSKSSR